MTTRMEQTPPWAQTGGAISVDAGAYRRTVQALQAPTSVDATQVAQVLDLIMRARAEGGDVRALEPTAPPEVREPAFAALLRPAIAAGRITGVTMADPDTLRRLYRASLGWGDVVQPLLDDPDVTEVKVIGCTVMAHSARGQIVRPRAFADVGEPLSRVQALAQLLGIVWDAANPSVTLPLAYKTRLHATRPPLLPEGDLLLVLRRGRRRGWRLHDLVERGAMDAPAADLLAALIGVGASAVIVGPQDSGKTTLLEALLHAVPGDRHIVLVEDATDELTLDHPLVTRLQVHAHADQPIASGFTLIMREALRMTPDVLAPTEVRGAEASAVLQIAEAGRPTLTTIHARTPQAGMRRLARLATTDAPGNTFAGRFDVALQTAGESVHLVVQMVDAARVGRRMLLGVWALAGVDGATGGVRLVPLIEADFDAGAPGGVRWRVHARLDGDRLAWGDGTERTPPQLAALLAANGGGGRMRAATDAAALQVDRLLAEAEGALDRPGQAARAVEALTRAARMDPTNALIWTLTERALLLAPDLAQQATAQAQQLCARLQEALERQDAGAAQEVRAAAEQGDVAVRAVLARDGGWRDLTTRLDAMHAAATEAATALATAYARATTQRDLRGALEAVRPFDTRLLPRATALEVVKARTGLLQALLRRDDAAAGDRALLERQLAALGAEQERLERLEAGRAAGSADAAPDGAAGHAPAGAAAYPPGAHAPAGAAGVGTANGGMDGGPPSGGGAAAGGLDLPDTATLVALVARRAVAAGSAAAPDGVAAHAPPGTGSGGTPGMGSGGTPGTGSGGTPGTGSGGTPGTGSGGTPGTGSGGTPGTGSGGTPGTAGNADGGHDDPALPFRCDSSHDIGAWSQLWSEFRRDADDRGASAGKRQEGR